MSQRESFVGGFVLGALVGGIAGGVVGAVLASRQNSQGRPSSLQSDREKNLEGRTSMEMARHTLEDKIAQLNLAIDDVRQQLGSVKPGEAGGEASQ